MIETDAGFYCISKLLINSGQIEEIKTIQNIPSHTKPKIDAQNGAIINGNCTNTGGSWLEATL